MEVVVSFEMCKVFEVVVNVCKFVVKFIVQDWNQVINFVIIGQVGGQIMGDWVQGEFVVVGKVVGEDYICFLGMGDNQYISIGGDVFYFLKLDDFEMEVVQKDLVFFFVFKEVQVVFNFKKGFLLICGDVDFVVVNDCMKKGLVILVEGNVKLGGDQIWFLDIIKQVEDLMVEFWKLDLMLVEQVYVLWVQIYENDY